MTHQGLVWVNSKITNASAITPSNFNKWYEEVHIPDMLKAGVKTAFLYKNIDPKADRPWFALYPIPEMALLSTKEFGAIPMTSDFFDIPSKRGDEVADFDGRVYQFIHSYENEGVEPGPAKLIISAALTPAPGADEDFDKWYKEEHCRALAGCTGYVRTRRYKLAHEGTVKNPPTYLSLHEFECDSLPTAEMAKTGETPWAKKIIGSLAASEIYVFALTGAFGDISAKL